MQTRTTTSVEEEIDWKQQSLNSNDRLVVKEALIRALLKQPSVVPVPNVGMDAVRLLLPELPELDQKWEGLTKKTFDKKLYASHVSLYEHVRTLIKAPETIEAEVRFRRPTHKDAEISDASTSK